MTHTLNRRGLSDEKCGEEVVVLCMVQRALKMDKMDAMKKIAHIVIEHKPVNIIGRPIGLGDEEIENMAPMAGIVTAVFIDKDTALKVVEAIKAEKLGVSVVLSALFSDVHDICDCAGLKEHTHHISLGIFGETDRLPDEKVLEITTQCGHSLISPHLVDAVLKKIRKGKMSVEEAAKMLVKPCACGIGNTERMERLLAAMV